DSCGREPYAQNAWLKEYYCENDVCKPVYKYCWYSEAWDTSYGCYKEYHNYFSDGTGGCQQGACTATGHFNPSDGWYCDGNYKEYQDWYADGNTCRHDDSKRTYCPSKNGCHGTEYRLFKCGGYPGDADCVVKKVIDCESPLSGTDKDYCCSSGCGAYGSQKELDCTDGIDNDCDGLVDCQQGNEDPDCNCPECNEGETRLCPNQDGVCDNSVESCTDGKWPGCNYTTIPNYETTETICTDGLDNDCDGMVDCEDSDCVETPACNQPNVISCAGGDQLIGDLNNDGEINETDANIALEIGSGIIQFTGDNLCCIDVNGDDALTDVDLLGILYYANGGTHCFPAGYSCSARENCNDDVDNDCDGLVDENDSDCEAGAPSLLLYLISPKEGSTIDAGESSISLLTNNPSNCSYMLSISNQSGNSTIGWDIMETTNGYSHVQHITIHTDTNYTAEVNCTDIYGNSKAISVDFSGKATTAQNYQRIDTPPEGFALAEECGNGIGYSNPAGLTGEPADKCCCFRVSHVHDIGTIVENYTNVYIVVKPGHHTACKSTAALYSSIDNQTWEKIASIPVMTEKATHGWKKQGYLMQNISNFRYLKVRIPKCYNDYSAVYLPFNVENTQLVITNITTSPILPAKMKAGKQIRIWFNSSSYPLTVGIRLAVNNKTASFIDFHLDNATEQPIVYAVPLIKPGNYSMSLVAIDESGNSITSAVGELEVYKEEVSPCPDLNHDGFVNSSDADILKQHWLGDTLGYDLNYDGVINIFDLAVVSRHWEESTNCSQLVRCPDINEDGVVDDKDYNELIQHYWSCYGSSDYSNSSDLNGDSCVGNGDLLVFYLFNNSLARDISQCNSEAPDLPDLTPISLGITTPISEGDYANITANVSNMGASMGQPAELQLLIDSNATTGGITSMLVPVETGLNTMMLPLNSNWTAEDICEFCATVDGIQQSNGSNLLNHSCGETTDFNINSSRPILIHTNGSCVLAITGNLTGELLLPSYSIATIKASWLASAGNHTLSLRLDPENNIEEQNESNNNLSLNFSVEQTPTELPVINEFNISPDNVEVDGDVDIFVNASNAQAIIARVILPDGTQLTVPLTNCDNTTITPAVEGLYEITVVANNSLGEDSETGYLMVGRLTSFSISVENQSGGGVPCHLSMYVNGTKIAVYSMPDGSFYGNLVGGVYDLELETLDNSIDLVLHNVNISDNLDGRVRFDSFGPTNFLIVYGVHTNYNADGILLTVSYAGTGYSNEDYLGTYKCDDWDMQERTCNGDWTPISGIQDEGRNTFTFELDSLSGFGIKQESWCGDGACTSDEDSISCPQDCPASPTQNTEASTSHHRRRRIIVPAPTVSGETNTNASSQIRCYKCIGDMRIGKLFPEDCPDGWSKDRIECHRVENKTEDMAPPEKFGWSPSNQTTVNDSFLLSFSLSEAGECRWDFKNTGYDEASGDCNGSGTTSITCNISGLDDGVNDVFVFCQDMSGNKDNTTTAAHLQYMKVSTSPLTGYATAMGGIEIALGLIAIITALAAVYVALTEIEGIGKSHQED
ncbi:MAG: hypothetical protein J7L23_02725, partial [Candidatus Diapherotrites archaeon]|nr:hypothetical protein [Candidatus Diapherotrites archaeon]